MGDEEDLLHLIKECWPQYKISKDNLLRPTQEVVVKFYSKFINDYNDKVAYLTGVPVSIDTTGDYEPEELLFQQASKLLEKVHSLKLTLADIYQPTRIRTKNFFKVCIHFLAFIDNILNDTDVLGAQVFKAREDMGKLEEEREELMREINENDQKKAEISKSVKELDQEYKSVENAYKEMKDKKAAKEKFYAEKKNQIETLKWEIENEEHELAHLESIEKELLEQKITETEYQNIQRTLETLKTECEMLDSDDVNIEDGLVHENEVLHHSANCLRMLNNYDFNIDSVKKLIKQEEQLKVVSNALEKMQANTLNPMKQQVLESEEKLVVLKDEFSSLQNEYKSMQERYSHSLKQFSQELAKIKGEFEEKSQHNKKIILGYQAEIAKLEYNMERLKKTFADEYIRVSKVENKVVEKFKNTLLKYHNLIV